MPKALTVQSVERLKPDPNKRLEIPDGLLTGLYLVIQPSGARSWAVRYRHGGRPIKLTLGPYPALDLTSARAKAKEELRSVASGMNPAAEKIEAARRARDGGVDQDLVSRQIDLFVERHLQPNRSESYAKDSKRLLEKEVRPLWGERRVQDITRRDVVELLDRIADRGAPITANRVLALIRRFFNWLIERSVVEKSPCDRVKAPAAEATRDRVLSDGEIRWLWKATERHAYPFGPFVRLLLLTGQRRDEVAKARHKEFSEPGLWRIPRERTKNGTAQDLPLSEAAQEVLADLPRISGPAGYLFTTTGNSPISGYSAGKQRLDKLVLEAAQEETAETELPRWTLHDLRRTAASGMARLGTPVHIIEAVLNHQSGAISGVAAVYNRHSYTDEKRRALDAWSRHVMQIVGGKQASNIAIMRA
jgi:integrase